MGVYKMQSIQQQNEHLSFLTIKRDIDYGGIKTVTQLLKRTGKASLPNSVFNRLLVVLKAKQASKTPMFLRKQTY
jgi:hypothetical protein